MPQTQSKDSNLFERAKNDVDPKRILGHLGLEVHDRGNEYAVLCPFHTGDSDPSLYITKTGPILIKCFGCGQRGSIIDLVMQCEGLSELEAAQQIAEWEGIDYSLSEEREKKIKEKREKLKHFEYFVETCHQFLMKGKQKPDSKLGKIYRHLIEWRHLNETTIQKAKVGFGGIYNQSGQDPIRKRLLANYDISEEKVNDLGLFMSVNGESRCKFIGYYTVPFMDRRGRPNYLTGRLLEKDGKNLVPDVFNFDDDDSWEPPRYRQASRKKNEYLNFDQLYNERQAIDMLRNEDCADSLFIVEGQFDALALMSEGYPAVAFSGTENEDRYFEQVVDILEMLEDDWDHVYVCFDREDTQKFFLDEKSGKKAIKLAQALSAEGHIARIIKLPSDLTQGYDVSISDRDTVNEIDPEELLEYEETFFHPESEEEIEIKGTDLFVEAKSEAKTWMDYALDRIDQDMPLEKQVDYIDHFLEKLTQMDEIIQSKYISELADRTELNKTELSQKLGNKAGRLEQERQLTQNPHEIRQSIEKVSENDNLSRQQKYRKIAQVVVDRLQNFGSNEKVPNIFFYNRGHDRVFMLYDGDFVEINRNDKKFRAVLSDFAKGELNTESKRGRAVIEELQAHAINQGEPIDDISWSDMVMDTNEEGDVTDVRVYFPLANENNELVKIGGEGEPEVVANAANEDHAIVRSPKKMDPWSYNPDVDIEKTMKKVKKTFWDQVALPPEQRLFLLASAFSIPVLDLLSTAAHIRIQGSSNSGKTEVGKIITTMMLGQPRAMNATDASLRKGLEDCPMVCIDDFERTHFDEDRMKILRVAISRGEHDKMSKKHEDSIITQKFRALVLTNGIDRITGSANRNRTFVLQPVSDYRNDEYYPEMNRRKLKKFRDDILSCMVKITHEKVIPSYLGDSEEDGKSLFAKMKKKLDNKHSDHPLDRLFGFLSIVSIYAKELSKYMPPVTEAKQKANKNADDDWPERGTRLYSGKLMSKWLSEQNQLAWESLTSNSMILLLLDALRNKFRSIEDQLENDYGQESNYGEYNEPEEFMREHYNIRMWDSELEKKLTINGTLEELFQAFARIAKEANIAHNFREPGTLQERMINSREILNKRNWNFCFPNDDDSDGKKVRIDKKYD